MKNNLNNSENMKNNTTISMFKNINYSSKKDSTTSIDTVLEIIRNHPQSDDILSARADGKYCADKKFKIKTKDGDKFVNKYNYIKSKIICATYNGNFDSRNSTWVNANPNCLSGYMYFDIDKFDLLEGKEDIKTSEDVKKYIYRILTNNAFSFIKAVWRSFGGEGFGFLCKIENLTVNNFKTTWESIAKLFSKYDVIVDGATKDVTRLNVVSYDPNIFVRTDVRPYMAVEPIQVEKTSNDMSKISFDGEKISNDVKTAHQIAWNHALRTVGNYEDGKRASFVASYGGTMSMFGIELEETIKLVENLFTSDSLYRLELIYNTYAHEFGTKTINNEENLDKNGIIIIPEGKHLSDVISFENCLNKMIDAPAGVGKTTLFTSSNNHKILFVAPTQSICNDIAAQCLDADVFHQHNKTANRKSQKIVTTVSSFTKIAALLGDSISEYTIIIDEVHCFVTNTSKSFAYTQYNKTLSFLKLGKQKNVIFCTATMPKFSDTWLASFDVIRFKREVDKNISYKIVSCADRKKYIKEMFEKSLDGKSFVQVFKNNKSLQLNQLQTTLANYKVMTVNADNKYTEDVTTMIGERKIKSELNGLISTSVIGEGVNLYLGDDRNNEVHVIIDGYISSEQIYQFSDRVRDAKKTTIHILKKHDYTNSETKFEESKWRWVLKNISKNNVNKHKKSIEILESVKPDLYYVKTEFVKSNSFTGEIESDFLQIDNELFKIRLQAESSSNDFLENQMKKYGISFDGIEISNDVLEDNIKVEVVIKSKKFKKDKKTKLHRIVEKIRNEGIKMNNFRLERNDKFDAEETKIRKQFEYISRYEKNEDKIFEIFGSIKPTKQSWNMFIQQIKVKKITSDSSLNSRVKKLYIEIYKTFKIDNTYTPTEINSILNELVDKYQENFKSVNKKLTPTETTKLLKTLFELKIKKENIIVVNENGEETKKRCDSYVILNDNPCLLNINTDEYNEKIEGERKLKMLVEEQYEKEFKQFLV